MIWCLKRNLLWDFQIWATARFILFNVTDFAHHDAVFISVPLILMGRENYLATCGWFSIHNLLAGMCKLCQWVNTSWHTGITGLFSMNILLSFKISGTIKRTFYIDIPDDLNIEEHSCEIFKSRKNTSLWRTPILNNLTEQPWNWIWVLTGR